MPLLRTGEKRLSFAVMTIVAVDVSFLMADFFILLSVNLSHSFHGVAPYMVFMATVLPAVVASLNGINFQSECCRLAERSAVMRVILGGKPAQHSPVGDYATRLFCETESKSLINR